MESNQNQKNIGVIVIPARFDSERMPGKPLAKIAGKEMLLRVYEIAALAASNRSEIAEVFVATDDPRIVEFCSVQSISVQLISDDCVCGTERTYLAMKNYKNPWTFAVNFQGDNPLCPPLVVEALIDVMCLPNQPSVATPFVTLSWDELDKLREIKIASPFSGTSTIIDSSGNAIWFSKAVLPSMRFEKDLRSTMLTSPVKKHIGVYAYSKATLNAVPKIIGTSQQMNFEGLEQLMFLEAGVPIKMISMDQQRTWESMPGINSEDLIKVAERIINEQGELTQ
jgi:3-deoxy-manno-octulosonate cytidylyltransferase (CMP-KDO synthetase)